MECPICKGKGIIEKPIIPKDKKDAVLLLVKNGFGIRMTQRLLGYKSPRSVTKIIENN